MNCLFKVTKLYLMAGKHESCQISFNLLENHIWSKTVSAVIQLAAVLTCALNGLNNLMVIAWSVVKAD